MRKLANSWVLFSGPLVTLAFTPSLSHEPFHTVKLGLLSIFAGLALTNYLIQVKIFGLFRYKKQSIVGLIFLVALIMPILTADSPFSQQLYGVSGRLLGFTHYFFLLCVFLGASVSTPETLTRNFLITLVATGFIESIYGLMQHFKVDPIDWVNRNDWVVGTTGNPNFLSAFIGMSVCVSLFLMAGKIKFWWRILNMANIVMGIYCISVSKSIQGLVLIAIGLLILCFLISYFKSKLLGAVVFFFGLFGGAIAGLGILQIGPLSKYMYQESTTFRGDYWRAGFGMAKDNFLTGVGLDSYGDYFRQYRDPTAAARRGLDNFSDSAHNLFIDLAANGGLILLSAYLLVNLLVVISIYNFYKQLKNCKVEDFALPVVWVVFQVQTLISINVSSVAIWGWIASGLLVAKNVSKSSETKKGELGKHRSIKAKENYNLLKFMITLISISIVFPLIVRDIKVSNSLSDNSGTSLQNVVLSWPNSCSLMARAGRAFESVGNHDSALSISLKSVEANSRCFDSFRLVYENKASSPIQKRFALVRMKELDPLFD